ncbi:MAG: ribosome assembly factor SBDS [Candidatus Altiarchaeota archaeon]|nr:ribosome assembly factor SBDS [Candidatus Altiarchaeota archaeon]
MAVKIEDAIVIRLSKTGERFEILVDPDAVMKLRQGGEIDFREALAVQEIFKDARKADRASESAIEQVFGTDDIIQAAAVIMKKGDFHPTAEQKRQMTKKVRNQIIDRIARNAIDPRTNIPHTRDRISWALDEAKIKIDMSSAAQQMNDVVKALQPILPLKFGMTKLDITIPNRYAPSLYGKIKGQAKILREQWMANGLILRLEIPSGTKTDFYDFLNNATKGEVIIKEEIQ